MTDEETSRQLRLKRLQKFIEDNQHLNPFAEIDDSVEWQREIRKEWERDFSKLDPPIER
ncbi:hypothetical protein [Mucilaginibacter pedocola]|uniref:hypothetical protein n=1 Tax=Mucilaginibacter pedocola TaxID=1792845 RepID=UPI0012DFDDA1|nr:hypothetical protein [Mucilaginibacter pedocola]